MTENLLDSTVDNTPNFDDPNRDYWAELTGPGGKFHDEDEAVARQKIAKAKMMSDHYIGTMEHQMDVLREDFLSLRDKALKEDRLQELLDQLKQQPPQASNDPNPNVNAANILDTEKVKSLVSELYGKERAAEKEQENYNTVLNKVKERYGNEYAKVLKDKASELGLSDEEVNTMARKNPKLFTKTFEVEANRTADNFQTPPNNQTRRDSFAPKTEKRTESYYNKLRRENPTKYFDPKTLIQMDKDLLALGDAFFDVPH